MKLNVRRLLFGILALMCALLATAIGLVVSQPSDTDRDILLGVLTVAGITCAALVGATLTISRRW